MSEAAQLRQKFQEYPPDVKNVIFVPAQWLLLAISATLYKPSYQRIQFTDWPINEQLYALDLDLINKKAVTQVSLVSLVQNLFLRLVYHF